MLRDLEPDRARGSYATSLSCRTLVYKRKRLAAGREGGGASKRPLGRPRRDGWIRSFDERQVERQVRAARRGTVTHSATDATGDRRG